MSVFRLQLKTGEQKILQKRTELLAQNLTEQQAQVNQQELECLVFSSGGIQYAIEKEYVQEMHRQVSPLPVPCTPDFVKGIVNIRGSILSVNDLGLFLGHPALLSQTAVPLFKLQDHQLSLGILADSIDDIRALALSDIFPFEQPEHPRLKKYLLGLTAQMLYVLDAHAILSDPELIVKS